MNHTAAAKTPKLVLSEWLCAFRLLTKSKLAQIGKYWAQPVKLLSILLDDVVSLTPKTWRLEVLLVLNNLIRHLLDQIAVIFLQDALRSVEFVLWCSHNHAPRCSMLAPLLVAVVFGQIPGPRLLETRLVGRHHLAQQRDDALVFTDDGRNRVSVDGGAVPSRHRKFGLIPRRRNVVVWPMEDDENLAAGGEMLPLRVGACHVGYERAVETSPGMKQHRQVAGERGGTVVADEGGEAVPLDKRSELAGVRNSESGWNIHGGITGGAPKRQ